MEFTRRKQTLVGVWLRLGRVAIASILSLVIVGALGGRGLASTYVVYIPLNSPIYEELDTLNGLGYLSTYLEEIRPISRIEAARLTLEAESHLTDSLHDDNLARAMIDTLRAQLHDEIGWIENDSVDELPTMARPMQRVEVQYVFSRGRPRRWRTSQVGTSSDSGINAEEATPLMPNNDGLPTAAGSNETARLSGWVGLGGFLAGYGEGAVAGPVSRAVPGVSRLQPLGSAVVADFGNLVVSLGTEEMWWGTGHFAALSQGDNASPFPALRVQSIHPIVLPGFLRYLGQFRYQMFLGQLDGDRYFAHPWIDGEIFSFKPLPTFEIGLTHTIEFGGRHNDHYSTLGGISRAIGAVTGSPTGANTNSRGGVYFKWYFPRLRNLQVYQEIVGEDNLTREVPGIGRLLPFLAMSFQGGFYVPRLTADGRADLRFEYAILDPNYSGHSDSLYWTYEGQLMADPLGLNATRLDLEFGRWLAGYHKMDVDLFYTEQAPTSGDHAPFPLRLYPYPLAAERSYGVAFDLLALPRPMRPFGDILTATRARMALEYVQGLNYEQGTGTVRALLSLSVSLNPDFARWEWK